MERSTTISGLFSRVEVQTEAAFFKHDASVKVVEMGDASTLQPPCMPWKICLTLKAKTV